MFRADAIYNGFTVHCPSSLGPYQKQRPWCLVLNWTDRHSDYTFIAIVWRIDWVLTGDSLCRQHVYLSDVIKVIFRFVQFCGEQLHRGPTPYYYKMFFVYDNLYEYFRDMERVTFLRSQCIMLGNGLLRKHCCLRRKTIPVKHRYKMSSTNIW